MLTIHSVAGRAFATAILACAAMATFAQVADQPGANLPTIVVTAQHLNEERSRIDTQTGASTYTFNSKDIQSAPGGDNVQLNQVMLQVPDAAQDSFGQLHIRGDHNGLQFRLNGVILPDGISVFGQTLPPRMIASMKLITGSLPAEYGLRSAGIIDLTTKGGALQPGGDVSLYGGSHASIEPSFNYGGTSGSNTYFVTGDLIRNDLGIESPDGRTTPLHDHTKQYHGFGYFEHLFDETNRLSVVAGSSDDRFEIPNLAGVHAADIGAGLTVNGQTDFLSNNLNENQREVTQFAAVSLQHSAGPLSVQTSLITRYSSLNFTPDPLGDLLFNGIAEQAYKRDVAYALQSDGAYQLNESHTLRVGVYAQTDRLTSNTSSLVLQTSGGVPINDVPVAVIDETRNSQYIESAYLQDEWHINSVLVMNYGARFDHFTAFTNGSQLSPRVNFVWQAAENTTLHAGYSRFFSPPPFELVGSTTVQKFVNTTFEPTVKQDDPVKAERSNYYDVGLEQNLSKALTVGVDGYYKQAIHLIDEGQFGAPIILTPFNYRYGQVYGVEFTGQYNVSHFQAYGNLAFQRAIGKHFESSQFNFSPDDLAYVADHYIHLDHEQQMTASGGAAWLWHGTRLSGDLLAGSGLRASLDLPNGTSIPNGAHLPYYRQVNLGASHAFDAQGLKGLTARVDVINAFDQKYQIRNGSGVGVGASQYGQRRGYFVGVSQTF
ncbi:MAG: TonB-dependent receptor [Gammaproteobacteria bacterium]|nr:MAG: TonB-dependent receptor [Gammaproteobacteria bacterium]TLZ10422.1 MAG: TonB-dependent receptor [Gammaproteobacteria bacterium]TLZ16411.1 MAG: TonB-dependent receptor [Gammaproteobacteria bacterium]